MYSMKDRESLEGKKKQLEPDAFGYYLLGVHDAIAHLRGHRRLKH